MLWDGLGMGDGKEMHVWVTCQVPAALEFTWKQNPLLGTRVLKGVKPLFFTSQDCLLY